MNGIPRRILVPTDFSSTAEHALEFSQCLARVFAAEIHLVHIRILLDGQPQNQELQQELARIDEQSDAQMRETLGRQAAYSEEAIHPYLVRGLSVSESLTDAALDLGCDLIVVGTHGRRGLRHLLLGSVAEDILRTASIPVITVREKAVADCAPGRNILVPHDFSDRSSMALEVARTWAQALGARLTLLHVVEPVVYPEFYAVDVMTDDVLLRIEERSLDAMKKAAAEQLGGVPYTLEVATGRAVDGILDAASPDRCDLVIMATRGLSGLEHVLLGSVAEGVVRRCRVPVMTVRSEE
ncbi:MAG: universal stress protein [Thermoanaerobaculales bacterium]|nr:universal stress protein [Thermoanaerobaculales bacterium]